MKYPVADEVVQHMHNVHKTSPSNRVTEETVAFSVGCGVANNKHTCSVVAMHPTQLQNGQCKKSLTRQCGSFVFELLLFFENCVYLQCHVHVITPFLESASLLRWKMVRWRPVVHFLLYSWFEGQIYKPNQTLTSNSRSENNTKIARHCLFVF